MTLGRLAIKAAIASGAVVCDPAPAVIEETHIDVHLGAHYWIRRPAARRALNVRETDPRAIFQYKEAEQLLGAHNDAHLYVSLPPHSFALCHTVEFIGTTVPDLLPCIETRSTVARWGLPVHLSAGWGDPGYCSRFTLELWNWSDDYILLPVGARIGCVSFQRIEGADTTTYTGRYNVSAKDWTPNAMLPRMGNL